MALQFLLYTGTAGTAKILMEWLVARDFIAAEYPHVTLTIINPKGLKGIGWKEINW